MLCKTKMRFIGATIVGLTMVAGAVGAPLPQPQQGSAPDVTSASAVRDKEKNKFDSEAGNRDGLEPNSISSPRRSFLGLGNDVPPL